MNITLVIPTNRSDGIRTWLQAWREQRWWDRLVVVQDDGGDRFDLDLSDSDLHILGEEENLFTGRDEPVVGRRDSAVRSLGFLAAYQDGADVIATLDDDCHPLPGVDYRSEHLSALYRTGRWTELVPGLRTRGLPYQDQGMAVVAANIGLWSGVPDQDGLTECALGRIHNFVPPAGRRVMPQGLYWPWTGMNFAFRREFTPLSLFPLNGDPYPYRRWDDIWFGLIAQKACEQLGWHVTAGTPWVHHLKTSDCQANRIAEAPGLAFHEHLGKILDTAWLPLRSCWQPTGLLRHLAEHCRHAGSFLTEDDDATQQLYGRHCILLADQISAWANLF